MGEEEYYEANIKKVVQQGEVVDTSARAVAVAIMSSDVAEFEAGAILLNRSQLKTVQKLKRKPQICKKQQLFHQLLKYMQDQIHGAMALVERHELMIDLDVTAYCELLVHAPTPAPEHQNVDASLRPPTKTKGKLTSKHGYNHDFRRIDFL